MSHIVLVFFYLLSFKLYKIVDVNCTTIFLSQKGDKYLCLAVYLKYKDLICLLWTLDKETVHKLWTLDKETVHTIFGQYFFL